MSRSNNPSGVSLDRPPHAWGYARASTERQAITTKAQIERFHAYYAYSLEPKGVVKGLCFEDLATTSGIPWRERPQGILLFGMAQPGDHIVIYRLDRAFRSASEAAVMLNDLQDQGITLHIMDVQIDLSSPHGRLFFHILAAMAEWEKSMIRERTKEALAWKRERGLPTGNTPMGWRKVGQGRDSRYTPCEKNRAICYMIVELKDKERKSFYEISRILRRKGVFYSRVRKHKRANPADELAPMTVRSLYRAAKRGFPLPNGSRRHVYAWEPTLWRNWGIDYDESKPHDFQITVRGEEHQSVVEGMVQQE